MKRLSMEVPSRENYDGEPLMGYKQGSDWINCLFSCNLETGQTGFKSHSAQSLMDIY